MREDFAEEKTASDRQLGIDNFCPTASDQRLLPDSF
jgi:hypothetical protein